MSSFRRGPRKAPPELDELGEIHANAARLEVATERVASDLLQLVLVVLHATEAARAAHRDERLETQLSRIEEAAMEAATVIQQLRQLANRTTH